VHNLKKYDPRLFKGSSKQNKADIYGGS